MFDFVATRLGGQYTTRQLNSLVKRLVKRLIIIKLKKIIPFGKFERT
jgi:hypothetical protein